MNNFFPARNCNCDGILYPKCKNDIVSVIDQFFYRIEISYKCKEALNEIANNINNKPVLTFIVPHGAYYYSGYVSSFVYYLIKLIDCNNFIILSSDHNGTSPGVSVMDKGSWITPLGKVQLNEDLGSALLDKSPNNFLNIDPFSFTIDHSIETQLPFLQYVKQNRFNFIPLLQRKQDQLNSMKLAEVLCSISSDFEKVILIATSNFSHYLCYDECYRKDNGLISNILSLDINSFYRTISENSMTVCGFGCIATAMRFSQIVTDSNTVLLKYSTSGDIDKNNLSVVGYSSLLIF